jgi:Pyruvate/2-oxoacid:ferredoxin oxidoreductase gamma subunit
MTTPTRGPKVVIAEGECQLNRQRRIAPQLRKLEKDGGRVVRQKFGVDDEVCTGDHSCIRLSGCPSLTIKPSSDPLRLGPGCARRQQLRGLRCLRRGRACRHPVSVVLSRRRRLEPDALGTPATSSARARDPLAGRPPVVGRCARPDHRRSDRMSGRRPITLTIAALGGQGGGVVADWMIAVARTEHYLVQATSVPGVAQRTGATFYYLEFFPEAALPGDGRRPVMALMPSPGDVDVVVASELVEAGRAMQRGLVTPDRTTLIASTHRAYTVSEKSNLTDGRVDSSAIIDEARRQARRFVAFDMAELAEQKGAIISSVILGALAGASGLPFGLESYRQAIRAGGIAVESNLAAFDASVARAQAEVVIVPPADAKSHRTAREPRIPPAMQAQVQRFPETARTTIAHGIERLIDYQDMAYAELYLVRLEKLAALEPAGATSGALTEAAARGLALWMSFEDTMRVAQLKTRPSAPRQSSSVCVSAMTSSRRSASSCGPASRRSAGPCRPASVGGCSRHQPGDDGSSVTRPGGRCGRRRSAASRS